MTDIEVHMGDIAAIRGAHSLITSGVGSCLVITLYDPKLQIGALAHAMLPSSRMQNTQHEIHPDGDLSSEALSGRQACLVAEHVSARVKDTRCIDVAIDEMLSWLETQGARREDLEAKLVGGANMFPSFESDIGKDNVLDAKEKLKREGIKIVGECVGGTQGRSVDFSPTTGVVTVKVKF
jgi:chemotaxis protein CheD